MKKPAKILVGAVMVIALLASLQGCETMAKLARSKTGRVMICGGGGALTGAGLYAACDALVGKKDVCIAAAVAAALIDGLNCWWELNQKIVEDYDDTRKTLQYDLSQGYIVKILRFDVDKDSVRPGEQINITMKYALMSPVSAMDEIKFEHKSSFPGEDKPRIEVITRQPGTWGSDEPYTATIPASTPDGKIELQMELTLIGHQGKQVHDRRTLCFNVSRDGTLPKSHCQDSTGASGGKLGTFQVQQDAGIRAKPSGKARIMAPVRRGESFPATESKKQGGSLWYKITLENGREGWIPAAIGLLKK